MKLEFDPEADALYLELSPADVDRSEEIRPGVVVDYDSAGEVVGIEVLHVGKRANQPLKQAA